VLPLLVQSSEIKMVRQKRLTPVNDTEKTKGTDPDFEYVWKVVDPNEVPPRPRFKPKPKEVEVGVDLDYGHIIKRGQNARVGETGRDIEARRSFKYPSGQDQTTARD